MYTGNGNVPKNVVLVQLDSSIVQIRKSAFRNCNLLKEVVLNEGLKSISKVHFLTATHYKVLHFRQPLLTLVVHSSIAMN